MSWEGMIQIAKKSLEDVQTTFLKKASKISEEMLKKQTMYVLSSILT